MLYTHNVYCALYLNAKILRSLVSKEFALGIILATLTTWLHDSFDIYRNLVNASDAIKQFSIDRWTELREKKNK